MKKTKVQSYCLIGLVTGLTVTLTGCAGDKENVLAVTGTVIGVQIHQKDTDKTPEMKVGYVRSEFAYVPTDKRTGTNSSAGSATDSAEVLMEINAGGSVTLGSVYQGAVYQRLAVGKIAVTQPGAAVMLAKNQDGKIDPSAAVAVANATKNINAIQSQPPPVTSGKMKVLGAYNAASPDDRKKFEAAAKAAGYADFTDFCTKVETTDTGLNKVIEALKSAGINL